MKNWQETARLFNEIARLMSEGRNGALAVIVALEGSGYRAPGAKLLVRDDGSMIGNVSGGCLENDVMENSVAAMKTGRPKLLHYNTGGTEDTIWGLGVGCGGKVDVLVIPLSVKGLADAVEPIRELAQGDEPFCISMVVGGASAQGRTFASGAGGQSVSTGDASLDRFVEAESKKAMGERSTRLAAEGDTRLFTEFLLPPPRLLVCGGGDISRPVARLASEAGFRVSVVDHRPAYLAESRFPDAVSLIAGRAEDAVLGFELGPEVLAVVMFHILAHDKAWVSRLASQPVPYIGILGSRSRQGDIVEGLTEVQRSRVYGPVGLDIGAVGPEQMAVSIVAEVLAVYSQRTPGHLRDRQKPIHEK